MSSKFVKTNTNFPLHEIFDFRGEFSSSGLKKVGTQREVTTSVPGPKSWVTNRMTVLVLAMYCS